MKAERGEAMAAELSCVFSPVDIRSDEQVAAAFEKARAAHGQERILVNCAGIANGIKTAWRDKQTGTPKSFPMVDFERAVQINLIGTFRCVVTRSEEHTSELQSLMRISYAVFCLKKKIKRQTSMKCYT